MGTPNPNASDATSAAGSAALALAEASAAAGTTSAQLGYQLTTQALKEADAAVVFPLLLLEVAAIGGGFAAYTATDVAARFAEARVKAAAEEAAAFWSVRTP